MILIGACGGVTRIDEPSGSDSGSAGAGGAGGGSAGSSGSSVPDMCATTPVIFELTTAGRPALTYCAGRSCSLEWLSIRSASSNQAMEITHPCTSDCAACAQVGCDLLCALPQPIPEGGVRATWEGKYFTPGTCGQGNTCVNPNCAAPGKYVATMCAGVKTNPEAEFCETDPQQQCLDVAFDYPTQAIVSGTLGPIK